MPENELCWGRKQRVGAGKHASPAMARGKAQRMAWPAEQAQPLVLPLCLNDA